MFLVFALCCANLALALLWLELHHPWFAALHVVGALMGWFAFLAAVLA